MEAVKEMMYEQNGNINKEIESNNNWNEKFDQVV